MLLSWLRRSKVGLILILSIMSIILIYFISVEETKRVVKELNQIEENEKRLEKIYYSYADLTRLYIRSYNNTNNKADSLKALYYYNKADSIVKLSVKKTNKIRTLKSKLGIKK